MNRLLPYGVASTCLAGTMFLTSCDNDDDNNSSSETTTKALNLNITGLEDLGPDFAYEGWLIVDGQPVSAGIFNVEGGELTQSSFNLAASDVDNASAYVLTIEPVPDADPAPSSVHILAGDFAANSAPLSVNHGAAIATDFTEATGSYILATPTDDDNTNELSMVFQFLH